LIPYPHATAGHQEATEVTVEAKQMDPKLPTPEDLSMDAMDLDAAELTKRLSQACANVVDTDSALVSIVYLPPLDEGVRPEEYRRITRHRPFRGNGCLEI